MSEMDVEQYVASMPQGMGGLNEKMGIELLEVSTERVVATMPVEGNTQPYGLLHGGASAVLIETAGSIGAARSCPPRRWPRSARSSARRHSRRSTRTADARLRSPLIDRT